MPTFETFKDLRLGFSKRSYLRQSMEITTHGDPLKKGCVTLRCPSQCRWRLSYWQVVSSAPESNFTGRFDAIVSGAMILRHTDPQLGPIQLLCPPSAPRRITPRVTKGVAIPPAVPQPAFSFVFLTALSIPFLLLSINVGFS